MQPATLPLFPLKTVLFPGGPLPLRIFEARYLDMVGRGLKEHTPFGVVLILAGAGADAAASTARVGTGAREADAHTQGAWAATTTGVRSHPARACCHVD